MARSSSTDADESNIGSSLVTSVRHRRSLKGSRRGLRSVLGDASILGDRGERREGARAGEYGIMSGEEQRLGVRGDGEREDVAEEASDEEAVSPGPSPVDSDGMRSSS